MKLICQLSVAILLICGGCGDFLEEYSLDKVYAKDCDDLNELIIGNGYLTKAGENAYSFLVKDHYYPFLFIMDDDVDEYVYGNKELTLKTNNMIYRYRNFYTWQQNPYTDIEGNEYTDDATFSALYKCVGVLNVILDYVEEFADDDEEMRNKLRGEALTLRGIYYYLLANIYGLPYAEATRDEDLCVPLKLSSKVEDLYYVRNTTGEVYDQIVSDLKRGADYLKGIEQPTYYRVDERSARLILSRVYLYMNQWQAALDEADKILEMEEGAPLRDLRTEVSVPEKTSWDSWMRNREYMFDANCNEIFFTMGSKTMFWMFDPSNTYGLSYRVSTDLMNAYRPSTEVEDLRWEKWFGWRYANSYVPMKNMVRELNTKIVVFESFLLRSAEVYLNKAEAEAMSGDEGAARSTLSTLLEKRYAEGKVPDISGLTEGDLIAFIRDERRRELCFEGHRWFDLRRYAVSSKYPEATTIQHTVYTPGTQTNSPGTSAGYYELKPYGQDGAWMVPFPAKEIEYNEGYLVDNAREPREIIN